LPQYRICQGQCYGNFFGDFGRGVKNFPIGLSAIPNEYRDLMTHRNFREGVSGVKNHVDTVEGPTLRFALPPESGLVIRVENMAEDMVLAQAWINIDKSQIVGILSTVRNRILNFALEIEASFPEAGEAAP
jgi:AbiTii